MDNGGDDDGHIVGVAGIRGTDKDNMDTRISDAVDALADVVVGVTGNSKLKGAADVGIGVYIGHIPSSPSIFQSCRRVWGDRIQHPFYLPKCSTVLGATYMDTKKAAPMTLTQGEESESRSDNWKPTMESQKTMRRTLRDSGECYVR
jgi:hypothetical protein